MECERFTHDFTHTIDRTVDRLLATALVRQPPVDAFVVAWSLGLAVAWDERQQGRARLVRLSPSSLSEAQSSILLRPDQRPERHQWAVAHEIGEHLAHELIETIAVDSSEVEPRIREEVANLLAARLLLPTNWFGRDGRQCDWDLFELKTRYSTASHELIARRMLDFAVPIVVTVFDRGKVTWRRGNLPRRPPGLVDIERRCWQQTHAQGEFGAANDLRLHVRCWPVHEPHWKREVLRTDVCDGVD